MILGRSRIVTVISILSVLLFLTGFNQATYSTGSIVMNAHAVTVQTYTSHAPIHIDGNDDFLSQASIEGWPGDGSAGDAIIITGYSFAAAEHMLRVQNSNLHFEFIDNRLDGLSRVWCGVAIINSSNGIISENFVIRTAAGIHMVTVENMLIRGNEVEDSLFGGIVVENDSDNVTVKGNTIHANQDYGIFVGNPYGSETSNDVKMLDNIVYGNSPGGIMLLEANECIIQNNTICENTLDGIKVKSGSHLIIENTISACVSGVFLSTGNCIITGNNITATDCAIAVGTENNTIRDNYLAHNEDYGLRFFYSSYTGSSGSGNLVTGNTIANNTGFGFILLTQTTGNVIRGNDFLMNGGLSQACDNGTANTFDENFWDDWTGPDINSDGHVDNAYAITGDAENSDTRPLAEPVNALPDWYTTTSTAAGTTGFPVELMILLAGGAAVVLLCAVLLMIKKKQSGLF